MNKILTIIVTYNGMKWLDQCLTSVKNSTISSDLFIVDNGSSDGSIEFVKKNYPEAVFIESKENLGFGKANNLGLRHAVENEYEYVYLLNQDAWIEEDTFSKLIEASKANPDYGIISPLQVNREKTRLDSNFVSWCPDDLISDLLCDQPIKDIYETKFTMAAHWLIPMEKLKIIGAFSPAFQHYGEDDNLVNRCICKGFKVGIVPSTIGVHDREGRPMSLKKTQYMHFVHIIVALNNPLNTRYGLKFIKTMLKYLVHPTLLPPKYYIPCFRSYIHSRKFRRIYKTSGAFLDAK